MISPAGIVLYRKWLKSTGMKKERMLLSALWTFVTLNYLYCDLIGLMDARMLQQYLKGNIDGLLIDEPFLLYAGILMEVPIAMVLLSRILSPAVNAWFNIAAAALKTVVMILTLFIGTQTAYYSFFATIEIATTLFILGYALRWSWQLKTSKHSVFSGESLPDPAQ